MTRTKALRSLSVLTLLFSAASISFSPAAADAQPARLDFQIERQIEALRTTLASLESAAVEASERQRIEAWSLQLEWIERLQAEVHRGHPVRTEAQLHSRLGFLRAETYRLSKLRGIAAEPGTLSPTAGTFSGSVTGSGGAGGLEGVFIDVFDSGGEWTASTVTDINGDYTSPALEPDDYYARTYAVDTYINELYDNVPCYFICDITGDGQPIPVGEGSDTGDIDFELDPGNTVSGTITEADTEPALAIEMVTVDIFDETGLWVTNPTSDATGLYTTPGMPAGTYYAKTFNVSQYLNERFDDQLCVGQCDPLAGTPIVLVDGVDTTDIDFDLVLGGSISGSVVADPSTDPIEGTNLDFYDDSGTLMTWSSSDGAGAYISWGGLLAGSYYARTYAPAPYLDELYDDIPCSTGCDVTTGSEIAVSLGVTTSGIDFALASGGTFSGSISDGVQGLGDVGVEVYDSNGDWAGFTGTSNSPGTRGQYRSPGLPTGTYYARTFAPAPYINELYDDIPCFFCDVTGGTEIAVVAGTDNAGIDFELGSGGSFSGTVTDDDTMDSLEGVIVDIFREENNEAVWLANPTTDALGQYSSPGLPAGQYFASTWNTQGYVDEVYDDHPCPPDCDPLAGDEISVANGTVTTGIDFGLDPGGAIAGSISDRDTGLPVEDMVVEIWDASGEFQAAGRSDSTGEYRIEGLTPGTYYATTWNDLGYPGALYDGLQCQGCAANLGTPITVVAEATTSGIDFVLTQGGFVSGTVTAAGFGAGLADIHIELWSTSGHFVAWEPSAADGSYTTTWALPAGSYLVKTWNDQGYIEEVYPDRPCAYCDATEGVAIDIDSGVTTSGVDFALEVGGSISGTVTVANPDDVTAITVQVWDDQGRLIRGQRPPTTSGAYTIPVGLPTGTYYVRTAGGRPYVNEVWNDEVCLYNCLPAVDGDPISVTAPLTTSGVNFTLDAGAKLTGSVKDASTQLPIDDSHVEIFDLTGERVSGCRVGALGSFTCWQAIPDGDYYAATINFDGYIDETYGDPGLPCVGGGRFCDLTQSSSIHVELASPPVLDFELDRGGWFEGSVTDAQWHRGLAGTDLLIYDATGTLTTRLEWKTPLSLVPDGSFTTCGLPAGTYYALTDSASGNGYHADELFDDHPCVLGCNVLAGTPIGIIDGMATEGIDMILDGLILGDGFETADTTAWSQTQP